MKKTIIHKQGNQTAKKYIGFGRYEEIESPLCVGAKMLWKGYTYYISESWNDVTCKHCLKKLNLEMEIGKMKFNLTREQAIQIILNLTWKDDPYWENIVQDYYDEESDTMPTIDDVLRPLGVSKEEIERI